MAPTAGLILAPILNGSNSLAPVADADFDVISTGRLHRQAAIAWNVDVATGRHDINLAYGDIGEELLERRSGHVPDRPAFIVIMLVDQLPSFMSLAKNVRGTGFALRVEAKMRHALAVLAVGLSRPRWTRLPASLLAAGALVFSGTLYAITLGGPLWLGAITPLGGLSMICGWALLDWQVARRPL